MDAAHAGRRLLLEDLSTIDALATHIDQKLPESFTPAEPTREAANVFAKAVLERAEQLRKEIAIEWLGEELPPSIGQVLVAAKCHPQGYPATRISARQASVGLFFVVG